MILQLSSPFLQPVSIIIGEKLAVYQEPTYRWGQFDIGGLITKAKWFYSREVAEMFFPGQKLLSRGKKWPSLHRKSCDCISSHLA